MAVPSNPTVTEIVTEGLKRGGRVSPTSSQITDATTHQFREVKADINTAGSRADVLLTQYCSMATQYVNRLVWPTDASDIRSVQLVWCPDSVFWQSTATAGASTSVTLNASLNESDTTIFPGRTIFMISGTSVGQYRSVTAWNNTSKVATVNSAWSTNPVSGDNYIIEANRIKMWEHDKPQWYDTLQAPWSNGRPIHATMVGRELWMDYAPDRNYGIFWDYWVQIDRADEAGTAFIRHLREYRSLWVQGIAVKTMQRYDEDRYLSEVGIYNNMLLSYKGEEADIGQVHFRDV